MSGAYGVAFDESGRVSAVCAKCLNGADGFFLLGGGIEDGETAEDCLMRECLEEAVLEVAPLGLFCKGDEFHYIPETDTWFHGIGYFYGMKVNGGPVAAPTEPGHSLVWLTVEEARQKLFLPHQVWAVEEIFKATMAPMRADITP